MNKKNEIEIDNKTDVLSEEAERGSKAASLAIEAMQLIIDELEAEKESL